MTIDQNQTWQIWKACVPDLSQTNLIGYCGTMILKNWARYKIVADYFGAPAYAPALIHCREASFDFTTHLANGDPLFAKDGTPLKTVHFPQDLGPFANWEAGAIAALEQKGWHKGMRWDVANCLIRLEAYNGFGYRYTTDDGRPINSPYVWSMTNQYSKGKFGSDGKFDPNLVDKQCGCAPIMMALRAHGLDLNEVKP